VNVETRAGAVKGDGATALEVEGEATVPDATILDDEILGEVAEGSSVSILSENGFCLFPGRWRLESEPFRCPPLPAAVDEVAITAEPEGGVCISPGPGDSEAV
jgi:hypothetical protein